MIMTCSHPLNSSIESYFDTVGVVEHETHHRWLFEHSALFFSEHRDSPPWHLEALATPFLKSASVYYRNIEDSGGVVCGRFLVCSFCGVYRVIGVLALVRIELWGWCCAGWNLLVCEFIAELLGEVYELLTQLLI